MGSEVFENVDPVLEKGGDCAIDLLAAVPVLNTGLEAVQTGYHGAHMLDAMLDGEGGEAVDEALSTGYHGVMTFLNVVTGGGAGATVEAVHAASTAGHCGEAFHHAVENSHPLVEPQTPQAIAQRERDAQYKRLVTSGESPLWDEETQQWSPHVDVVPANLQRSYPDGESPFYTTSPADAGGAVREPSTAASSPCFDWSSINAIPTARRE